MMSLSRCKYVMFSRFPRVNASWGRGGKFLNAGSVRSGRGNGGDPHVVRAPREYRGLENYLSSIKSHLNALGGFGRLGWFLLGLGFF